MRPNLMGFSGNQMNLKKGIAVCYSYRPVFGLNPCRPFHRTFPYRHLIFPAVFSQIAADQLFLRNLALYETAVLFSKSPLLKATTQCLQTCQAFSRGNDTRSITVQPIADTGPEDTQLLLRKTSGLHKLICNCLHQRYVSRLRLLGQHTHRLIYKQHMFILIDNLQFLIPNRRSYSPLQSGEFINRLVG